MRITVRHRLEYALLMAIVFFIRVLPLPIATGCSSWCWRLIAPRTRRHARAIANLTKAMPEKSAADHEAIARAMWGNLGRLMAETFVLDRIIKDASRFTMDDAGFLDRYTGKLGPSVFASLHTGNWELVGQPFARLKAKPAAVYRVIENPLVDRYLRNKRGLIYTGGMLDRGPGTGHAAAARIVRHLNHGGQVAMLTDLVDWKGIAVPFFGHPVLASQAPAWCARRTGARLWAAQCLRVGNASRFRIVIRELKVQHTDNMDDDIKAITESIYRQFELWIRETPEQWMWSNKRWRELDSRAD